MDTDVNFEDVINKDRALPGHSDCSYSTSSSRSCSRVGGGDKVSCETLLEVIRNCHSKRPVKIFSKTMRQEDENDDSLQSSSSSSSSFSWSSSSSASSSSIGGALGDLFGFGSSGGADRGVPGIFGWFDMGGGDNKVDTGRGADPQLNRQLDPFNLFNHFNEQFKIFEDDINEFNSNRNESINGDVNNSNRRSTIRIERLPQPPSIDFNPGDEFKNERNKRQAQPRVPPHVKAKNSETAAGPVEEI
jgi:hypothetical protein